eukprot:3121172-Pyramimonas_sp.AAC.1
MIALSSVAPFSGAAAFVRVSSSSRMLAADLSELSLICAPACQRYTHRGAFAVEPEIRDSHCVVAIAHSTSL